MSQYDSIEQKASYGIGRNMGDQLAQQAFAGLDIPALQQGLADALNGLEFAVSRDDINDAFQVITARMQEEQEAVAKAAAADGEAFLADNAKRADVKVTDSGLQYEVMVEGNGAVPVAGQSVRVHYHGTFTHGGVFDPTQTDVNTIDGVTLARTVSFYDNEYGFTSNMVRTLEYFAEISE